MIVFFMMILEKELNINLYSPNTYRSGVSFVTMVLGLLVKDFATLL